MAFGGEKPTGHKPILPIKQAENIDAGYQSSNLSFAKRHQ